MQKRIPSTFWPQRSPLQVLLARIWVWDGKHVALRWGCSGSGRELPLPHLSLSWQLNGIRVGELS